MRRGAAWVGLLVVLFMFLFVLEPLPVHAASTLVQQNNAGRTSASNPSVVTVTLNSVTSGDVLVVGLQYPPDAEVLSLTDSLHSSFTQAASTGTGPGAAIWTATLSSSCAGSGCDTVTATFVNPGGLPNPFNVFVYEVAGVTTTGFATGTGSGTGTPIFTSSVSFQAGAFLLGMIEHDGGIVTRGAGFTLSTENSGSGVSNGQWSDPVSSPTTFPATLSASTEWHEAGIALNPAPTPPIPEYPLGLPILAILTVIGYGLVRRRTRSGQY